MEKREKFSSRLGFILISAGCAIGLGNVWRFPFITGQYGGAAFVLMYLVFLVIMGLPIMTMEFAVGRASGKSMARSFHELEPKGSKWHWASWIGIVGNYMLMMFYTSVCGWMLYYVYKMAAGGFVGTNAQQVSDIFSGMLASPGTQLFWMVVSTLLGFAVCSGGLQKGVERITKPMMLCLLGIMVVLAGESLNICVLDTFVALTSGLIIFPACFAFGVDPGEGPGLVFVTIPNIFNQMAGGRFWGTLFFIFMSFAALSTVIAVFENIISFGMDKWGMSRKKAVAVNLVLVLALSVPCALGFNVWKGFAPFGGSSTIQDLEDFIVSNNLLPIGSLVYLLFCTRKAGWGWDNFLREANTGKGVLFPAFIRGYVRYVLPLIIIGVFVMGYWDKFFA